MMERTNLNTISVVRGFFELTLISRSPTHTLETGTRHALEMCTKMQSQLQRLKARHVNNMERSQRQEKLQTETETSLRKQLNETIKKLDTVKEDRKKRKSESVRRVRELKMSVSRKSKLLEASKTRVTELENELTSLKSKHKSLQGRVERSKLNLSRRENLMKDTKKRFAEIGNDLRTHKEELAASKSRLRHEIAALKSCRNRNESLREEITRLREKLKTRSNEKRKDETSSPKRLKRLRDEMFRVQASERSARAQVKTLSTELKKQKAKVSELISEATERAKRFDQDMKKSAHTERERVEKLRVATESISEAVVAMFAALLAGNARLHKGLRREDDQREGKDGEEDEWSLRERHQEILSAVQGAVDRRPPDEMTLQVLLAETVQERIRVQSARDVVSATEEEDDVASVIRRYEELIEELRGRLSVERVSSRLAIEKYEAQLSALRLRMGTNNKT